MNKMKLKLEFYGCFLWVILVYRSTFVYCEKGMLTFTFVLFLYAHIDVVIGVDGKSWPFTKLYENSDPKLHKFTWHLVRRMYDHDDSAWIMGGDLNEVLWDTEKWGEISQDGWLMNDFSNNAQRRQVAGDLCLSRCPTALWRWGRSVNCHLISCINYYLETSNLECL